MASDKQELIHLHQLLAQIRFHTKDNLGMDAEISELPNYKEVGITSIKLDAAIETQLEAVLALANDLTDVLEAESRPAKPSAEFDGETPVQSAGPSETTTLFDIAADGSVTADTVTQPATAESTDTPQPTGPTPEPASVDATISDDDARVVPGYVSDEKTGTTVDLVETSLLDSWSEIRKQRAEQGHSKTPAEANTPASPGNSDNTAAERAGEGAPSERDETTQVQLAVDVEQKGEEVKPANGEQPIETEQAREQAELSAR